MTITLTGETFRVPTMRWRCARAYHRLPWVATPASLLSTSRRMVRALRVAARCPSGQWAYLAGAAAVQRGPFNSIERSREVDFSMRVHRSMTSSGQFFCSLALGSALGLAHLLGTVPASKPQQPFPPTHATAVYILAHCDFPAALAVPRSRGELVAVEAVRSLELLSLGSVEPWQGVDFTQA